MITLITPREKERVLAFIQQGVENGCLNKPLPRVASFLRANFVWTSAQSKKRASEIIRELDKLGKVTCQTDNRGIVRTIRINGDENNLVLEVKPALVKKTELPSTTSQPEIRIDDPIEDRAEEKPQLIFSPKIKPTPRKVLKKGVARRKKEAINKGDRNEQRFHRLMGRLITILKDNKLSSIIIEANYFKSGRHNPKKGQIDIRDKQGEDGSLRLTIRKLDGRLITGRIIYDPKSSYPAVVKFNRHIRYLPGQEEALLKKAIKVNPKRTDREIVGEVIDDIVTTELLPSEIKEGIQSYFSEF